MTRREVFEAAGISLNPNTLLGFSVTLGGGIVGECTHCEDCMFYDHIEGKNEQAVYCINRRNKWLDEEIQELAVVVNVGEYDKVVIVPKDKKTTKVPYTYLLDGTPVILKDSKKLNLTTNNFASFGESVRRALKPFTNTLSDTEQTYEMVDHPDHYNQEGRRECIEEMILMFGSEAVAQWCVMTAYKYRYRDGNKPGATEDAEKAEWYLNKAEEIRRRMRDGEL